MAVFTIHLHTPVKLLVVRPAIDVDSSASLGDAARRMRQCGVSALLVDGGAAILTERDLSRALSFGMGSDQRVSAIATAAPVVIPGDLSILDATARMLTEGVRHLVVDVGPEMRGLVSMRTLTAVLLQAAQPEPWMADRHQIGLVTSEIWLG